MLRELQNEHAGIYFDWGPDQQAYLAHVDQRPFQSDCLEAAS